MDTAAGLREVALEQFSASGYLATSLQQIADAAGVSKASVLYHYASKEQLLEAALAPTLDALEGVVGQFEALGTDPASRAQFLGGFVDFLLEHRRAVYLFVSQSGTLVDVPGIERGNALVQRIAEHFEQDPGSPDEKIRFGIALAGSAYLLAQHGRLKGGPNLPPDQLRDVLVRAMADIMTAPAPAITQ